MRAAKSDRHGTVALRIPGCHYLRRRRRLCDSSWLRSWGGNAVRRHPAKGTMNAIPVLAGAVLVSVGGGRDVYCRGRSCDRHGCSRRRFWDWSSVTDLVAIHGVFADAQRRRNRLPFAIAVLSFLASFASLAVSFWQYISLVFRHCRSPSRSYSGRAPICAAHDHCNRHNRGRPGAGIRDLIERCQSVIWQHARAAIQSDRAEKISGVTMPPGSACGSHGNLFPVATLPLVAKSVR